MKISIIRRRQTVCISTRLTLVGTPLNTSGATIWLEGSNSRDERQEAGLPEGSKGSRCPRGMRGSVRAHERFAGGMLCAVWRYEPAGRIVQVEIIGRGLQDCCKSVTIASHHITFSRFWSRSGSQSEKLVAMPEEILPGQIREVMAQVVLRKIQLGR